MKDDNKDKGSRDKGKRRETGDTRGNTRVKVKKENQEEWLRGGDKRVIHGRRRQEKGKIGTRKVRLEK